jgi:PilZ domain
MEARRHPRFKLKIDVRIYPRNVQVVRGHSVDISESGLSAMLREEVPLAEVVRLEFTVPTGDVAIHALVRQRNAFRYGFQFLEAVSQLEIIARACRQLALAQSTPGKTE